MMRRIPLSWLIALVALVAIGAAALRSDRSGWTVALTLIWWAVLSGTLAGVILLRGRERMPFLGAALFAWTFLVYSHLGWFNPLLPSTQSQFGFGSMETALDAFATDNLTAPYSPPDSPDKGNMGSVNQYQAKYFQTVARARRHFSTLIALVFTLVGGLIGTAFGARSARTAAPRE